MNVAASTIGVFCLPGGCGERRGKHFGRFSLAAASPEGIKRMEIPGQARDEGGRADTVASGPIEMPRGRNGKNITSK